MTEKTESIEDVQRRLEDGVLWITLNRPEAGNAMTVAMRNEIIEWLDGASLDPSVRAVVLTGRGEKGFCTGADLREARAPLPKPPGAPDSMKLRMSFLVTRPLIPVPSSCLRSMPCSSAILRTRGLDFERRNSSAVAPASWASDDLATAASLFLTSGFTSVL